MWAYPYMLPVDCNCKCAFINLKKPNWSTESTKR